MKKLILKIIIIALIIFNITVFYIDYQRVKNNKYPLFTIKVSKSSSHKEYFVGLFYQLNRVYKDSRTEDLSNSYELKFGFWFMGKEVKYNFNKINKSFKITLKQDLKCDDTLNDYLSIDNLKIKTYCIEELYLTESNQTSTLAKVLKDKKISLESFYQQAKSLNHQPNKNIYNYDDFDLIDCNYRIKNKSIQKELIISKKDKTHLVSCPKNPCIFTKTFTIEDITQEKENLYLIGLKKKKNSLYKSVEINNKYLKNLKENESYDFTFINEKYKKLEDKNLEDLFEHMKIEKIEKSQSFKDEALCY